MQWRAMSYLDMISSSERTSRTSGRWTRRPWKANGVYTKALGCRSTEKVQIARRTFSRGVCEPRDSLCSRASLHQSSARSCAWGARRQRGRIIRVRGLVRNNTGTRGSDPRCR
ncbi:unnamed protein product [Trichogramma brassicae]|uniref:Uncharacterized protein n=1 Tax=Trichogramma brassicae TaxID=86971 RepID=A0A6H5IE09_9HYME|nr:unnamed protein product [Trichogramma brassicae]